MSFLDPCRYCIILRMFVNVMGYVHTVSTVFRITLRISSYVLKKVHQPHSAKSSLKSEMFNLVNERISMMTTELSVRKYREHIPYFLRMQTSENQISNHNIWSFFHPRLLGSYIFNVVLPSQRFRTATLLYWAAPCFSGQKLTF